MILNIHISGKSVKSVFSATLLRVFFSLQSVRTASYLIKHSCFREIREIREICEIRLFRYSF